MRRSLMVFVLALILMPAACDKSQDAKPSRESKTSQQSQAGKETDIPIGVDIAGHEDPDDPSQWDQPRLQLTWRAAPMDKKRGDKRKSLWSVKVDGTDFRRTMTNEFLYSEGGTGIRSPIVRSPDNRYIAINVFKKSVFGVQRRVYDLKEKKMYVIAEGGGAPSFQWSPDSKTLLFYNDLKMYEYAVDTKELTQRNGGKRIYSKKFRIQPNANIIAFLDDAYVLYSSEGKKLKEYNYPPGTRVSNEVRISPNGSLIAAGSIRMKIFRVDSPEEVIFDATDLPNKEKGIGDFLTDSKYLVFRQGNIVYDLEKNTSSNLGFDYQPRMLLESIINTNPKHK